MIPAISTAATIVPDAWQFIMLYGYHLVFHEIVLCSSFSLCHLPPVEDGPAIGKQIEENSSLKDDYWVIHQMWNVRLSSRSAFEIGMNAFGKIGISFTDTLGLNVLSELTIRCHIKRNSFSYKRNLDESEYLFGNSGKI